jgi:hypothetical protein
MAAKSNDGSVCSGDGTYLMTQPLVQHCGVVSQTKEHLDAYLASAAVIIDQRDEPG